MQMWDRLTGWPTDIKSHFAVQFVEDIELEKASFVQHNVRFVIQIQECANAK